MELGMGLKEYIIRRLILLIPVILGVVVLIFALIQVVPPERRVFVYLSGNVRELNPTIIKQYIHMYGLDQPVWVQFASWLNQLIHGNLGYSEYTGSPVLDGLLRRAPATIEIVIYCAPLIVLIGIWAGVNAAVKRDKAFDHASRVLSVLGTSMPSFFFGILLSAIFIATLKWTGPGRLSFYMENQLSTLRSLRQWHDYTNFITIDALLNGRIDYFIDALKHLVLPVTVLVFINTATLVRVARSSMLEALSKTYVIAARAKGLSQKEVVYKHARRNALIPVVTLSGLIVGGMMTGLVITETVFNFPGLGRWAADAAIHFDVPVVVGYAMFSAIVFVISNLIVDILYAYIDPRIRLG
jgi:peptide/nickel transport system permease protein